MYGFCGSLINIHIQCTCTMYKCTYMPTVPDFPVYYRKTVRPTGIPEFYKKYTGFLASVPGLPRPCSCYASKRIVRRRRVSCPHTAHTINARVYTCTCIRIWERLGTEATCMISAKFDRSAGYRAVQTG